MPDLEQNIFTSPVPVIAASYLGPALIANQDADWDEKKLPLSPDDLVQKIIGQPMRRAGRFIKLVCCGALACVQSAPKEILRDKKVGIFLSTGLGNIDEILPFITQVFKHDGGFPSPNQFANSVSNAAAFFLAREAGIKGVVLTISEEEMSFESALWLAQTYLESGEIDLALVGGCDVFTPTAAEARERMNLTSDNSRGLPVGEGSSWLLLGQNQGKKLGDILLVCFTSPQESGLLLGAEQKRGFFLPGFRIKEDQIDNWKGKNWQIYDYLPSCGIHSVASAYGIAHALLSEKTGAFLHYNINSSGRHAFILAQKK
ncbi:MAG TPA: beta-ketoacyl synthase N-terminal-like domain-containing protein [Smithellaceae bacterium]|nr:beta-ketoacyl synthase N-terminal-like domain-containing protein [Smithellaceae bacterium]HRS88081.1 beta-ketoacyl synthase N-terminal-like domain-containing protein [Smithellaceae bacterium]HRV25445.1 beta-ketoacyl synthase N-terminal-like domain-containing protein [Smithellaceae bacterium]